LSRFFCVFLWVARGLLCRILMLNLGINFAAVANRLQLFCLVHHQNSINQQQDFGGFPPLLCFLRLKF